MSVQEQQLSGTKLLAAWLARDYCHGKVPLELLAQLVPVPLGRQVRSQREGTGTGSPPSPSLCPPLGPPGCAPSRCWPAPAAADAPGRASRPPPPGEPLTPWNP